MLGLFGLFGRSQEMLRLDDAFRACGMRPRAVPDAVKLTLAKLVKEANAGTMPELRTCTSATELVGYCMLGREEFAKLNGQERTAEAEARLIAAIESGRTFDARLVLLTMHAAITHPSVVEQFGLGVE
jgi:hypothetical protein